MASQGFTPSKKITRFSDVIYSHLERLSNLSTFLIDNPTGEKIYNYQMAIEHLEAILSPYITKESGYENLNKTISAKLDDEVMYIEIDSNFQVSYIKLLQKKLSLLMAILYDNNLLETKQDSYGKKEDWDDDEDGVSD